MESSQGAYNPLERRNLAESVASALLSRPAVSLPPPEFEGAGVYALYYTGRFSAYVDISRRNSSGRWGAPIYVGRAVPSGSRRGHLALDQPPGSVLSSRLSQHAQSIEQARNLESGDFYCKFLVVDDIWIPLAESLLITMFRRTSVWNILLDGFGNHDPGGGRRNQRRSPWDTVHPGRPWAVRLASPAHDQQWWLARIEEHLADQAD